MDEQNRKRKIDDAEFSIDDLKQSSSDSSKTKKINTIIKNALNKGWTVTKKESGSKSHCFELKRKINE